MKLFNKLMKRLEIRSVRNYRDDARLWMKRHNFSNVSDVKKMGYNNLPDFVHRYIISTASTTELITYISLIGVEYIPEDWTLDYENGGITKWKLNSYSHILGHSALAKITSYSYTRQKLIFNHLFTTEVNKTIVINDNHSETIPHLRNVNCIPIEHDSGDLVMDFANELCSYRNMYGIQLSPNNITIKALVDLYIDKYSSTLPFMGFVYKLSRLYTISGISTDALIYVIKYMGFNLDSMVDINQFKSSSYPPNVMSISDYVLRHLRDEALHNKISQLP